jgi:hypothetical protein
MAEPHPARFARHLPRRGGRRRSGLVVQIGVLSGGENTLIRPSATFSRRREKGMPKERVRIEAS